jgi:hypothetical protein
MGDVGPKDASILSAFPSDYERGYAVVYAVFERTGEVTPAALYYVDKIEEKVIQISDIAAMERAPELTQLLVSKILTIIDDYAERIEVNTRLLREVRVCELVIKEVQLIERYAKGSIYIEPKNAFILAAAAAIVGDGEYFDIKEQIERRNAEKYFEFSHEVLDESAWAQLEDVGKEADKFIADIAVQLERLRAREETEELLEEFRRLTAELAELKRQQQNTGQVVDVTEMSASTKLNILPSSVPGTLFSLSDANPSDVDTTNMLSDVTRTAAPDLVIK